MDAVAVGADRVTANGDTANKIGTLQLAIAAARYKIPFLVVSPLTSCDPEVNTRRSLRAEAPWELSCSMGVTDLSAVDRVCSSDRIAMFANRSKLRFGGNSSANER